MPPENSLPPFVIDCDTGRDDALALFLALGLKLPLAGVVASYGNVKLGQVIDNTARILSLAGREDCPLFAGAAGPLREHSPFDRIIRPRQQKSGNGVCNLSFPEAQRPLPFPGSAVSLAENIRHLAERHGKLDYIVLGPATSLAQICQVLGDETGRFIGSVTMLGGKLDALWEQVPGADFNLLCDPFAVRALLDRGLKPRFVPLDTTWPICLDLQQVETLQAQKETGCAARDLIVAHTRHFAPEPVFRFHDPAVIATLSQQDRFHPVTLDVNCDDESDDFGRLILGDEGFPALLHQADDALRQSILETILSTLGLTAELR